jgi:ribosomal protein L12E/L44/L45/RPP1/RPP2
MSDDLHDDDIESDDPNDSNVVKALRRQAREAKAEAKELREQAARAADAERRLAFAEAGVKLDDPKAKYFVKGYDGEQDAGAIKSAWQEFSGVAAPVDTTAGADIAAAERMSRASAGAATDDANEQQRYLDELEALKHNGTKDPVVLQREALKIMQKYGSQVAQF